MICVFYKKLIFELCTVKFLIFFWQVQGINFRLGFFLQHVSYFFPHHSSSVVWECQVLVSPNYHIPYPCPAGNLQLCAQLLSCSGTPLLQQAILITSILLDWILQRNSRMRGYVMALHYADSRKLIKWTLNDRHCSHFADIYPQLILQIAQVIIFVIYIK